MTDFVIVEYNGDIGGRLESMGFGASGKQYTVELGANWVSTFMMQLWEPWQADPRTSKGPRTGHCSWRRQSDLGTSGSS